VDQEPEDRRHGHQIVEEADGGNQQYPGNQPGQAEAVENRPQQGCQGKDDPSAPDGYPGMRTPLVGMIDDPELFGDAEIDQDGSNQENERNGPGQQLDFHCYQVKFRISFHNKYSPDFAGAPKSTPKF